MSDVLIIEDDLRVCEFVRRTLGQAGIPFRVAMSGRQALRLASETWPGLVLLDLTLAGQLDGWQVWDALHNLRGDRLLNVIVLTGDPDPTTYEQALLRGALGIVLKPIHPGDLANIIQQSLIQS